MNEAKPVKKLLIIIVPAYNEEEMIQATVSSLKAGGEKLEDLGIESKVYVIDDGSRDGTGEAALEAGVDRLLRHKVNLGLGAAIRTGLKSAREDKADIVVKFDADLQHDPGDIPALISPILEDEADVVYGNRFEHIEYRMPFIRRIGNWFFIRLMRFLTGWPIQDSQPGIFAVNKDYLEVFNIPGDYNYTQQVLLDAYHKGMRFAQVPVRFKPRVSGKSFVSLKYPFKVGYQILLVLASIAPMRIFAPFGLLSILIGFLIFAFELVLFFIGRTAKPVLHVNAVLGALVLGLQTFFFGLLAELIVRNQKK